MRAAAILAMLCAFALSPLTASDLSSKTQIPDDERETAQRASNMFKAQHYEEAAGLYRIIIQDHPDCWYAWSCLGGARFQQQRYGEARDAFARAVALNPKDASSVIDLGIAECELKDYHDAASHLQAGLVLDPENVAALIVLGTVYDVLGRHAEADAERVKADAIEQKQAMRPLQDAVLEDKTRNSS